MPSFAHYPSLHDRSVLITGGASGIGATLVCEFARQGARVGFIDIDNGAGQALVAQLASRSEGSRHTPAFVAADLTDIAALEAAVDSVRDRIGPIAALLNNAANDRRHTMAETTPESWDAGIAVNLKHQFFCARKVAEDMRMLGGGSIINFGSTSWKLKHGGMPVYTTSKAAVQGLTRSLARDLGRHKIRVNTLVPGWVMTDKQVRLWLDDAGKEEIARGQCIAEPLLPQHIAHMALFLAADDSAMCTAQDFIVDGGWV
ncbi:MAG: SDR family oxidoreductase [Pseudomonadota bacterium]|nr:SDR family oxidoreductase [Pseudomonadota bacterium]